MNFRKCIAASVLFIGLLTGSSFAQNGKTGNTSQAVLTIQMNVVPIVAFPQQQAAVQNNVAVAYSIPVNSKRNVVTKSVQEQFVSDGSGNGQRREVTLVTVVAE